MNAVLTMSRDNVALSKSDQLVWPATASSGALVGVLDIRAVFPRISEIVQQALPHDALALNFTDRAGRATLEARSTEDLPAHVWCPNVDGHDYAITSDLRRVRYRFTDYQRQVADSLVGAGYQSVLTILAFAQNQAMRLGFFSKQADAYSKHDVP